MYYFIEDEHVVVIACTHGRQHPRRWSSRQVKC
jgi:plasmid stabilization system protein ParE